MRSSGRTCTRARSAVPHGIAAVLILVLIAGCLGGPPGSDAPPTLGPDADLVEISGETVDTGSAEYAGNGTVRYVAARARNGSATDYGTASFDEYARFHCTDVALEHVPELMSEYDDSAYGYGSMGDAISITVYERSDLDADEVRQSLPDGFAVTVTPFDRTRTCRLPIVVEEQEVAAL